MHRLSAAVVAVWLAAMCLLARPHQVGDASEYVAMAGRLASGRPPAMTAEEMAAFTRAWAGSTAGYELQSRQLDPLRGTDGRYDMPHSWVYPLIAVPGVWLARLVGAGDPWGLVLLNVALVLAVLWLAVRRGAGPWTLTLLAGPLAWWIDKPISDLFIACLVALAALAWPAPLSIVLLGLAAAQNPALGVAAATFTLAAVAAEPARLRSRAWQVAVLVGVLLAALPAAYCLVRIGRITPLTVWTDTAVWPSWAAFAFPVLDLNLGFVPRFLPGALAMGLAMLAPAAWRVPGAIPGAVTMLLLLLAVSQQPSHNTGGHPDFSRYWLWVWPFAFPFLLAQDASPTRGARLLGSCLLAAALAWSTMAFRMDRPETYRYPTPLAAWVWRAHPGWSSPLPEAFAERTSHREPGLVPTSTPGCEKVLLANGAWPASCPPRADAPAGCLDGGVLCYANRGADGTYTFEELGRPAQSDLVVHDRTWPRADDASRWVERAVRSGRAGEDGGVAQVRAIWGAAWRQSWVAADGRMIVYVRDVGEAARMAVRHPRPVGIRVTTPDGHHSETTAAPGTDPTMILLPPGAHVLVDISDGPTPR
ncbi:hypothetical protein TBR22_A44110 [Luteitalea sp. TBR-22]|uniref:hypothetical protein n=1 Tax=Luteitalea sp. TBR-22 TaxID=2802971 RepID=UPI001AFC3A06|nr:hypothetical protein [Luteitalea sp. TBR-22]BCS35184.1 hypothetical protein TBR22_A44110 [Luteitalea sp. TBR-22]